MRVMSWNLWWRIGGNWQARQGGIVSTLRELQPDVAGLQEVWGGKGSSQAEVLADRLGMHAAFAAPSLPPPPATPESPDQEGIQVGVAVLSRWPILHVHAALAVTEAPEVAAVDVPVEPSSRC
jgi:endonuclease/exonuclease/phosphatase family metal-dependent hydrolase